MLLDGQVSYSMVVLFTAYTFQFQAVSGFFNETLGLSEKGNTNVLGPGLMYGKGAFLVGSVLPGHLCKLPSPSRSGEMPLAAPSSRSRA